MPNCVLALLLVTSDLFGQIPPSQLPKGPPASPASESVVPRHETESSQVILDRLPTPQEEAAPDRQAYVDLLNSKAKQVRYSISEIDASTLVGTLPEMDIEKYNFFNLSGRKEFFSEAFKNGFFKIQLIFAKNATESIVFKVLNEAGDAIPDTKETYVRVLNFDLTFLRYSLEGNNKNTIHKKYMTLDKASYKYGKSELSNKSLESLQKKGIQNLIISFNLYKNIKLKYSITKEGFLPDNCQSINDVISQAKSGNIIYQMFLYDYYCNGNFVTKNPTEALAWLTRVASTGHIESQLSLGHWYQTGLHVKRDLNEARKWYLKAANQGDSGAQLCLAMISASEVDARAWHQIGVNKRNITYLNPSTYDELSLSLPIADILINDAYKLINPIKNASDKMRDKLINKKIKQFKAVINNSITRQQQDPLDWYFRPHFAPGFPE